MTVLDGVPSSSAATDDGSARQIGGIAGPKQTDRAITPRSLLVGTLCVIAVCAGTPINDLILSDTSLVAGFLPLAAVLLTFILVVAVNAPLHRFAPRHALRTGELAVVLLMTLVSCGIPNWGLMRFLAPTPVSPFHMGASDERFWDTFVAMGLPQWLFPVDQIERGRTDPTVTWFFTRVPRGEDIPWGAWLVPMFAWGVFAAAMIATLVALGRMIITQWMTNERLPLPLVQVQAALIESPAPGFAFNRLFRSPMLWIALGGVFAMLMLNGLSAYTNVPVIPLKFDFTNLFSEEPFYYLRSSTKKAALSFTVVGVTFFIRSRAALSLWATYLLVNLVDVQQGMRQGEIPTGVWQDQHLGACIAFVLAIAWIGRHYWLRILRDAFGLRNGDADADADARRVHRWSFWVAVAGTIVMLGWLLAVGVKLWMAALIVIFILVAHVIVSRVVAETGLPFYRSGIAPQQVYSNMPIGMMGARDVYFANVFTVLGPLTTRDSVMTFAQHGVGVCQSSGVEPNRQRGLGRVMAWALIVGFLVAGPATLWCQYNYPTPVSQEARPARNYFGAEYVPQRDVRNPTNEFGRGKFAGKPYSPATQVATGFGITATLQWLSLRFAGWPLLPVGYLASHGAFMGNAWFSIFIGWLAQRVVVALGGAKLFERARPFFIGIIFGECLAAGLWLLINAILVVNGYESKPVTFLL